MALSAGILVYRRGPCGVEVLLAHPGGPFWSRRDRGAWSVPKGLVEPGEDPMAAAQREFLEETGLSFEAPLSPLAPIRQAGGKTVMCWAAQADLDLAGFVSNTFEMEWPPRSGRTASFPEIDRLCYFPAPEALWRVLEGQAPLIRELLSRTVDEASARSGAV